MAHRVCPWWIGYLLASPLRRWFGQDPAKILSPYVREAMTVLEPGPGMGFFTIPLARLVGPSGRVVTVDLQPKMIESLKRRASKAGVLEAAFALQKVGPREGFSVDWQSVKKYSLAGKLTSGQYKSFQMRKVERSSSSNPPGAKTETL
jgi:predicted methyltransferase